MKTIRVIYLKRYNEEFSVEFIQLEDGCIDVWHNDENGRELKINSFGTIDHVANLENATEWALNDFLPNHYDNFEVYHTQNNQ